MEKREPVLSVAFFQTESNREPVRDWLRSLSRDDRRILGEDIKAVQFGWPLGMPLVRKLDAGLWEIRSHLPAGIARMLFTAQQGKMVLLHGFIKKSQKTPADDLELAKKRLKML